MSDGASRPSCAASGSARIQVIHAGLPPGDAAGRRAQAIARGGVSGADRQASGVPGQRVRRVREGTVAAVHHGRRGHRRRHHDQVHDCPARRAAIRSARRCSPAARRPESPRRSAAAASRTFASKSFRGTSVTEQLSAVRSQLARQVSHWVTAAARLDPDDLASAEAWSRLEQLSRPVVAEASRRRDRQTPPRSRHPDGHAAGGGESDGVARSPAAPAGLPAQVHAGGDHARLLRRRDQHADQSAHGGSAASLRHPRAPQHERCCSTSWARRRPSC